MKSIVLLISSLLISQISLAEAAKGWIKPNYLPRIEVEEFIDSACANITELQAQCANPTEPIRISLLVCEYNRTYFGDHTIPPDNQINDPKCKLIIDNKRVDLIGNRAKEIIESSKKIGVTFKRVNKAVHGVSSYIKCARKPDSYCTREMRTRLPLDDEKQYLCRPGDNATPADHDAYWASIDKQKIADDQGELFNALCALNVQIKDCYLKNGIMMGSVHFDTLSCDIDSKLRVSCTTEKIVGTTLGTKYTDYLNDTESENIISTLVKMGAEINPSIPDSNIFIRDLGCSVYDYSTDGPLLQRTCLYDKVTIMPHSYNKELICGP